MQGKDPFWQCDLWGGAEGADESHCGSLELRGFGDVDDINNGNWRAPSPLLRGPSPRPFEEGSRCAAEAVLHREKKV